MIHLLKIEKDTSENNLIPGYMLNERFIHSFMNSSKKGPVNLIKRVKVAHSFLQSVSDQFHVIILSLPM